MRRILDERLAGLDGVRIAVERDQAAARGLEDGAGVTTRAEGRVNVASRRPAGAASSGLPRAARECASPAHRGVPVPGRPRDGRVIPVLPRRRRHRNGGCSAPKSCRCSWTFCAGLGAALVEGLGCPHLKLVAKADKSDLISKTGVAAKPFRKDDAPVAIDRENLDVAVERDRELVALVRIVRQAREKPVDLFRKSLAASIERWSIERGVAVDASELPWV